MTPFQILEISPTTDKIAIRRAYVSLAKKHHPDNGGTAEHFDKIQQAYNTLISCNLNKPIIQHVTVLLDLKELLTGCVATAIINNNAHKQMIEFVVPPLTSPGSVIQFNDSNIPNSIFKVTVGLTPSPDFKLIPPHVVVYKLIDEVDAKTGIDLEIQHFDGNSRIINIPSNTSAQQLIYIFSDEGFFDSNTKQRGDFKVVVNIKQKGNQHE